MSDVIQKSTLRGDYRRSIPSTSVPSSTSSSPSDVSSITNIAAIAHSQILIDRPDPVKIGWTTFDVTQFGIPTLPKTGYGPGSLYFVIPTLGGVSLGTAIVQTWLLTNSPQPGGVGNWVLVSSLNIGSQIQSGGGGGDSGSGGGDGGSG